MSYLSRDRNSPEAVNIKDTTNKEGIFVLKDEFYIELMKYAISRQKDPTFITFSWKGEKIVSNKTLLNHCYFQAQQEIINSEEFQTKIKERMKQIFNEYVWVKDKEKYSRCGKWVKRCIGKIK